MNNTTGFKFIGNTALDLERAGYEVLFGYEEAIGFMFGSEIRDKDGIAATVSASAPMKHHNSRAGKVDVCRDGDRTAQSGFNGSKLSKGTLRKVCVFIYCLTLVHDNSPDMVISKYVTTTAYALD